LAITVNECDPVHHWNHFCCGSRYEKIYFEEILYVEGAENYSIIHTLRGKFMTLMYLKMSGGNSIPGPLYVCINPILWQQGKSAELTETRFLLAMKKYH
jgi:hypothetical protein